jgi:hypothetical protein
MQNRIPSWNLFSRYKSPSVAPRVAGARAYEQEARAYAVFAAAAIDWAQTLQALATMQSTTSTNPLSAIPLPDVAIDEPVAVIPMASVAPLDGEPYGERINVYALAPKRNEGDVLAELRERVLDKPFTYAAIAFSLGFMVARVLR